MLAAGDPRTTASKPLAVFSSADRLFLYDIQADAAEPLLPTGSPPSHSPRFRTPSQVTFVRQRERADDLHTFGQDSIYQLDLERGEAQEMVRLPARVVAFDWNPEGTEIAYLVELGDQSDNVLCILDAPAGEARPVRSFSYTIGRGGHQWDEVAVSWAAAAGAILVVNTTTEPPTIHVVDSNGRDLVSPQTGTFGRWLGPDEILFLEGDPQATLQPWHWFSMSTTTGQKREYRLPEDAFRPAISPDGASIAFDDGADVPSSYLFDVASGASRRLARGYIAPVWLRADLIAATGAGPCPTANFCVIPWSESGETIGVNPSSLDQRPLALPTTLQRLVRSGTIDVLRPAT